MKTYICIVFVGLALVTAEALQCYQCANARSNEECNAAGRQDCPSNALMCENLVRELNGQPMYFKQCKQDLACGNNVKGNTNGPQCRPSDPIHSECWCCCNGRDGCNEEALPCLGKNDDEPSCGPPPEEDFAEVECCGNKVLDDGTYPLGSTCTYTCDRGGNHSTTTCQRLPENPRIAVFVPVPLECPIDTPPLPPTCIAPEDIENGKVDCGSSEADENGMYALNSTCTYACNQGFRRDGSSVTICQTTFENPSFATFRPTAKCVPTCEEPEDIENGSFECEDSVLPSRYDLESRCFYDCDEGYLLEGSITRTCELVEGSTSYAEFQPDNPRCIACDEVEEITNGKVDCTNDNKIGSTCSFFCDEGYNIFPADVTKRECLTNATWSRATPCCFEQCTGDRKRDFVFVLDSSGSISRDNWEMMLNFTSNFIRNLTISPDAAQVGAFSFDRSANLRSQILLNDFRNDKDGLMNKIENLPFRGDKKGGTQTGRAFKHAREVVFTKENGFRGGENILILVTDGNSNNRDETIEEAGKLRDKDIVIFAVGIHGVAGMRSDSNVNFDELRLVTGDLDGSERLVRELTDFTELSQSLAVELGRTICAQVQCLN